MQTGRQVGRLAQRQLFLPGAAAHLPHDDQPGMDPQAHRQLHPPLLRETGIELPQGLDDPQPGPHGPLGVIFVRQGVAKVDEQAVAEILRDMALKAGDHLGAGLLIGPHHLAQVFRVELADERRRVHEVTEQDGELAPFRLGRGGGSRRRYRLGPRRLLGGRQGGRGGATASGAGEAAASPIQTSTSPSSSAASRWPLISSMVRSSRAVSSS